MTPQGKFSEAIRLIRLERERQVLQEGFTAHNDKIEGHENLIMAAATYEMEPKDRKEHPDNWPWDMKYWKPTANQGTGGRIRELVKAGALYMAAKAVMESKGLQIPLKQAICEKVDLMAEMIAELLEKEEVVNG